jgi:uncharacterized protein YdeI (YjbR/CyaY-like superfamily)
MESKEPETFYPKNQKDWRTWLEKNHNKKPSIWLIQYKKGIGKPTIGWSEAVDEALCFGWVDGKRKSIDAEKFMHFFCKRRPKGTWSKINKEKIKQLIAEGRMTQSGLDCIEAAKQNGSWNILDEVEELTIPKDLSKAFKDHPGLKEFFSGLSKSVKKAMLHRLAFAKRPETRQNRINEIVQLAAKKLNPKL